jgi:predicted  nucleic acid-binding Zn-ribbon protein
MVFMRSTLQALQVLQQVELQLRALRSKIDGKDRSVRAALRKLERIHQDMALKQEEIRRCQATIGQLELEVKTHDAEIGRLREALNRSKTNKEYAAILTQINTDKAGSSKTEDRILELMDHLESLRTQQSDFKKEELREQARHDQAVKEAESFEEGSREELEALQSSREEAASRVPPAALAVFKRASERHDGEVLAFVIQPHPKRQEFICDGCNMTVTLEQYVALQSREDIQICQSCSRVLCLEDTFAHKA